MDRSFFLAKPTNKKPVLKKGIQSIIKNTKDGDKRFDRRKSKKGDPYFVLLAKNGEPLGRSEMYKRNANMEKGIKSVIKNTQKGVIKDLR